MTQDCDGDSFTQTHYNDPTFTDPITVSSSWSASATYTVECDDRVVRVPEIPDEIELRGEDGLLTVDQARDVLDIHSRLGRD